jgi:LacI family transcriptional regulator
VARLQAFRSAVDEIGLRVPESYIFHGDHTVDGGERGVEHLLALSKPPTAIMCSNDMTAIGAMHALSRAGLSIPKDISLIGFDDIRISEYMLPPLTTIRMSGRDIAASAVTSLLDSSSPPREVETKLVVRQTTSVPAGTLADLRKKSGKAQRGR